MFNYSKAPAQSFDPLGRQMSTVAQDPNAFLAQLQSWGMPKPDAEVKPPKELGKLEFGLNMPTLELGLKGAGSLMDMWSAFQAQKMAKRSFGLTSEMANANLNNSITAYNTSLEGKANRASQFNGTEGSSYVRDYLDKHALSRGGNVNNGAVARRDDPQAQRTV